MSWSMDLNTPRRQKSYGRRTLQSVNRLKNLPGTFQPFSAIADPRTAVVVVIPGHAWIMVPQQRCTRVGAGDPLAENLEHLQMRPHPEPLRRAPLGVQADLRVRRSCRAEHSGQLGDRHVRIDLDSFHSTLVSIEPGGHVDRSQGFARGKFRSKPIPESAVGQSRIARRAIGWFRDWGPGHGSTPQSPRLSQSGREMSQEIPAPISRAGDIGSIFGFTEWMRVRRIASE